MNFLSLPLIIEYFGFLVGLIIFLIGHKLNNRRERIFGIYLMVLCFVTVVAFNLNN
jgi:hypothetical protein